MFGFNEATVTGVIALVGLIAWFSRLEAKVAMQQRDADRIERRQDLLEAKHVELDSKVMEKLLRIEAMVAKLVGQVEGSRK